MMTPSQLRALCNDAAKTQSYPMIAPEHILAILDSVEQRSVLDELDTVEQFYKRVCAQMAGITVSKGVRILTIAR